jgi:Protein of unknown function (DUF2809).
MKLTFNFKAFGIFLLIFLIEVLIALFVKDRIIRPYGGDVLVVIMIYYFVKSFVKTKPLYIITGVLIFAYTIEIAQYFKMVEILGVHNNKVLTIILGSSFSWIDMLAYTIGALICYLIDGRKQQSAV